MTALGSAVLVGTWELVSFHVEASDGRPDRYPYGPDARGRIVYAADGHMMAVLSSASTGAGGSLETAHRATEGEKARAFDRYLSYSGRWRLDGQQVHHMVDLALAPGVAGTTQTRRAVLDGERLTLSYERTSQRGIVHRFVLIWTRPTA